MLEDNHDDELDSLIDQALSSYGAEPSMKLEEKIIAEARSGPMLVKNRVAARWLGIGSGIAAAGLAGVLLLHHEQGRQVKMPDQMAVASRTLPFASSEATRLSQAATINAHTVSLRLHHPHSVVAKQAETQAALTDQEQMLVELVARHPDEARQLVDLVGQEAKPLTIEPLPVGPISSEPLKIAALHIEPLR